MKKFITIAPANVTGHCTIDLNAYDYVTLADQYDAWLQSHFKNNQIYESITVKNFRSLSKTLVMLLTTQWLHGATLKIQTAKNAFVELKNPNPKPYYTYAWTPYDMSAPIPKSLATFKIENEGVPTTYLAELKKCKSTKYLPNVLWNALDKYSQERIEKCKEYNKIDFQALETWYKTLTKELYPNVKVFSPNAKTYFEFIAERDFERAFPEPSEPLTPAEKFFLETNAPKYGVEIPKFTYRDNTRKTKHGYTVEPERVAYATNDWREEYDKKRTDNLPRDQRWGLRCTSVENNTLMRQAYDELIWLIENLGDEALDENYIRCPECGDVHHISEACFCGHDQPIEFISADNLFYSNASTYEELGIYNDLQLV